MAASAESEGARTAWINARGVALGARVHGDRQAAAGRHELRAARYEPAGRAPRDRGGTAHVPTPPLVRRTMNGALATQALIAWMDKGINAAMNQFNAEEKS